MLRSRYEMYWRNVSVSVATVEATRGAVDVRWAATERT